MATFQVTDPQSGQTIRLTGDSPPTEQELEQIFSTLGGQQPGALQPPGAQQQPIVPQVQPQQPAITQQPIAAQQQPAIQQQPVTPFPEQPAETRAVKELPELGTGGLLAGEDRSKIAAITPVLLTTTDPQELGNILENTFPEKIGIQFDPGGNILATNNETGAKVVLNEPGLSRLDVLQGLGIAAAFAPAGRLATLGTQGAAQLTSRILAQRATLGATGAAVTEAGIQAGQEATGGEFDQSDVALSASLGGAGEVAGAAIRAVGAPIIRAAETPLRTIQALFSRIPQAAADLIEQAGISGIPVKTTDIIPPDTAVGKFIQQTAEKIPFIGTGGLRASQQKSREEAIGNLATSFDVGLDLPLEKQIVESLSIRQKQDLRKAVNLRNQAVDSLTQFGDVPVTRTISEIDRQVANLERLTTRAPESLIKLLDDTKAALQGDFRLVKDVRTAVIKDIKELQKGEHAVLSSQDEAVLQSVKSAIDKDLKSFAQSNDPIAARRWTQSNKLFFTEFTKFKQSELKRLLAKGDLTPEVVAPILRGGKRSELNRLNNNLTLEGRKAARSAIIRDTLTRSGFPNNINPDRITTAFNKPNVQKAIDIFFTGADKKQLQGLIKVLDTTRRAQQAPVVTPTGQALVPIAAFAGGVVDPITTALTAGTLSGIARGYESAPVRNFLLKFANTKTGTPAFDRLVRQSQPVINAILQTTKPAIEEQQMQQREQRVR